MSTFTTKHPFFPWKPQKFPKITLNFRQNEFTVMSGRKKAVRRIFLFENLILFTKPKRTTQGGDVYQYKNSWLVSFKINFKKSKFPEKKFHEPNFNLFLDIRSWANSKHWRSLPIWDLATTTYSRSGKFFRPHLTPLVKFLFKVKKLSFFKNWIFWI